MSSDGNITSSTLTFSPTKSDNGKSLICRAENNRVQQQINDAAGGTAEDSWTIDVHCKCIIYYVVDDFKRVSKRVNAFSDLTKLYLKEFLNNYYCCHICIIYKITLFVWWWYYNGMLRGRYADVFSVRKSYYSQNRNICLQRDRKRRHSYLKWKIFPSATRTGFSKNIY